MENAIISFQEFTRGETPNYKSINTLLRKVESRLCKMPPKEAYRYKLWGYEFDSLPFLLNAMTGGDDKFLDRLRCVASPMISYEAEDNSLHKDVLKEMGFDFNVYASLVPAVCSGDITMLSLFFLEKDSALLAKILLSMSVTVFRLVAFYKSETYIKFGDESICNTQAFSYYLLGSWLFQLEPKLAAFLGMQFNKSGVRELLKKFCPEGCLHYKYIAGEIDSKELLDRYIGFSGMDMSTVSDRELLSLASKGDYTGGSMSYYELSLSAAVRQLLDKQINGSLTSALGSCAFSSRGMLYHLGKQLESKSFDAENALNECSDLKEKLAVSKSDLSSAKKTIASLESEVSLLKLRLSKHESVDKLESEIQSLRSELSAEKGRFNDLVEHNMELKRTIRAQKKEIKRLSSSSLGQSEDDMLLSEESVNISIQEMVDALKNKRILVVGGNGLSIFINGVLSYGITDIRWHDSMRKSVGKCDILVIMTKFVSHMEVRYSESLIDFKRTALVYFNGTNVENFITTLYEEVCSNDIV